MPRYFIYQDAQIMGPFTREDLGQVHGLSGDSLVCSEASMGNKDTEWRSALEISELSSLFSGGVGLKAAPALEMLPGGPPDVYDKLTEENRILFDGFGYGGEWTSGLFEDPDFFRQWGSLVESATSRSEELELAKLRSQALEKSLDEMGAKLVRYERQQNEILERLNLKDRALEAKEKAVQGLESKLPQLERSLEMAREELRQARGRLSELQSGVTPAAWKTAPAAPPPPPPPPPAPAVVEPAFPAAASSPAETTSLPRSLKDSPGLAGSGVVAPIAPQPVFAPPISAAPPEPPKAYIPPPLPPPEVREAYPEPVVEPPPRPRLDLPATIKLQPSTLKAAGVAFTPPVPVPANVELAMPTPLPTPRAGAPEPRGGATEPRGGATEHGDAVQPLPAGDLISGWGDASGAPPVPTPEVSAPSAQAPEPEPVVFSPEPAQPPETLVQRRPSGAVVPGLDLLALPDPQAASSGQASPDLPPIPTPEPMPAVGAPGGGLVELTLTPMPRRASLEPAPQGGSVPDVSTPARLEPVGALERPHTMVRSIAGPPPVEPAQPLPAMKGLFPDLSTPAPVASAPAIETAPKMPVRPPAPVTDAAPPPGTQTMQRRRQSKTFLIGLGVAFAGLLATGVFFLKDPKEVIQLFTMSPKKGRPMDPDQVAGPSPTSLSQVKPLAAPSGDGAAAATKPPETPAPGRDFVADSTVAAMDFAKKQPVGKGKTALGEWLSSTFLKRGDEEEWSAGAVEGGVYLVSYRYFKGGKTAKQEPVTYLFEVDLDKKTIKGRNPVAKELLAGAAKAPAPRKSGKRVKKSRAAASEEARQPAKEEEPAPLDDLLGPPSQEPATPGAELTGE